MNIKLTALIAFFIIITNLVVSQTVGETSFVSGEIMVQLKSKTELTNLLSKYELQLAHTISNRFNIYLLKFDDKRITNETLIVSLKSNKEVVNVQNNHIIDLRESQETLPNDSLFDFQWSLLNTGQSGGTAGADIGATLAWDISTGGITALGDTVVVAILDGGADLNHEDLNFWKNKNEIPNNNIDDDNNGYIDDYDGWNAYNHSGNIPMHLHGTHVAGIAGAIGNNEIGVTGVNWNVKTLPVVGDSRFESIVVEALSYIYTIREQYDLTNGEQGAFIVADNCSFGVDNGQPEDFPIWEAMYDSLGRIGVLSMGATANSNWDIDEVGDVPTGFTTDYMISVTNTTNKDKKFSSAAYGLTTIDLGAPGTTIRSCGLNNSYTNKTGTSMATPHVTGAAALLISAADSAFITEYKNNPAQVALMIKDYLLSGVDPIDDLQGVTVTGGRLNIFNSINLMLNRNPLVTNIDSSYQELPMNSSLQDSLILSNSGNDTLVYTISIANQPSWITLSQYNGMISAGDSNLVLIQFNSTGYDSGYYNCNLDIEVEESEGKTIPVQMYVYDNVGIQNTNYVTSVKVFPNPATSHVNFIFNTTINGIGKLEIFDRFGSIVHQNSINSSIGKNKFLWDIKQQSGIYFYRLYFNNNTISSGKLVTMQK